MEKNDKTAAAKRQQNYSNRKRKTSMRVSLWLDIEVAAATVGRFGGTLPEAVRAAAKGVSADAPPSFLTPDQWNRIAGLAKQHGRGASAEAFARIALLLGLKKLTVGDGGT